MKHEANQIIERLDNLKKILESHLDGPDIKYCEVITENNDSSTLFSTSLYPSITGYLDFKLEKFEGCKLLTDPSEILLEQAKLYCPHIKNQEYPLKSFRESLDERRCIIDIDSHEYYLEEYGNRSFFFKITDHNGNEQEISFSRIIQHETKGCREYNLEFLPSFKVIDYVMFPKESKTERKISGYDLHLAHRHLDYLENWFNRVVK